MAIQSLESAHSILYGLAIWSGLLWALLMYRLFADRQVGLFWCLATVFFTAFIGIPLLGLYLQMPGQVFERIEAIDFFPLTLLANIHVAARPRPAPPLAAARGRPRHLASLPRSLRCARAAIAHLGSADRGDDLLPDADLCAQAPRPRPGRGADERAAGATAAAH